jgi:hypothetical protein
VKEPGRIEGEKVNEVRSRKRPACPRGQWFECVNDYAIEGNAIEKKLKIQ